MNKSKDLKLDSPEFLAIALHCLEKNLISRQIYLDLGVSSRLVLQLDRSICVHAVVRHLLLILLGHQHLCPGSKSSLQPGSQFALNLQLTATCYICATFQQIDPEFKRFFASFLIHRKISSDWSCMELYFVPESN